MTGYNRVLAKVANCTTTRNRKGAATLDHQKILGNTEWFRVENEADAQEIMPPWDRSGQRNRKKSNSPDNRHIEALVFVPFTPRNHLKNKIMQAEQALGYKNRFRFI